MISGECRVEPIPFGNAPDAAGGRKLAIDGLRLRLDLRIVPDGSGGDAVGAAVWRIENARLATLPLGLAAPYRWVAVAAGLGAVLLALGVWFAGAPSAPPSSVEPSAPAIPVRSAPSRTAISAQPKLEASGSATPGAAAAAVPPLAPGAAAAGVGGASPVAAPAASHASPPAASPVGVAPLGVAPAGDSPAAAPSVAPRIAVVPAVAASTPAPAAPGAAPERANGTAQGQLPRRTPANAKGRDVGSPVAVAVGAPAANSSGAQRPAAPQAPAPRTEGPRGDMLDLFGDPK